MSAKWNTKHWAANSNITSVLLNPSQELKFKEVLSWFTSYSRRIWCVALQTKQIRREPIQLIAAPEMRQRKGAIPIYAALTDANI